MVSNSRRCCKDRLCLFYAMDSFNIRKMLNGVILLCKAQDLTIFLIETVKLRIPYACNAALVWEQTNGVSVR